MIYDKTFKEIKSVKLSETGNCVAINSTGEIYIGIQNHIEVYDMNAGLKRHWATSNKESVITGIAVNDSSVFAADAADRVVHQYDFKGKLINILAEKMQAKAFRKLLFAVRFLMYPLAGIMRYGFQIQAATYSKHSM